MKEKNKKTSKLLFTNTIRIFLVFILIFGFTQAQNKDALKNSSGDEEIDQIRKDIKFHPTDESNYIYRGSMLKLWQLSLQQQGAILSGRFKPVYYDKS